MAVKLTYDIKGAEIKNTDFELKVRRDGKIFGTLTFSKGTIDWRPSKKWVGGPREIQKSWVDFDKMMRGVDKVNS